MDCKEIDDVIFEINNFMFLGGRMIVDVIGLEFIGWDVLVLWEVVLKMGLNIVVLFGFYLEKFESIWIYKFVELLVLFIDKELN